MKILEEWGKPRTIFALMIYAGFIYGFASGAINADAMIAAFSTIVGFHFGAKNGKKTETVNVSK